MIAQQLEHQDQLQEDITLEEQVEEDIQPHQVQQEVLEEQEEVVKVV